MERESNPMPMCRSGCGFYGNPAQDGLCSVCYKDSLRKKQQPPVSSTPVSVPSPQQTQSFNSVTVTNTAQPTVQSLQINEKDKFLGEDCSTSENAGPSISDDNDDKEGDKDSKKKKNRCAVCRKKVGLTGFECRCAGLFVQYIDTVINTIAHLIIENMEPRKLDAIIPSLWVKKFKKFELLCHQFINNN